MTTINSATQTPKTPAAPAATTAAANPAPEKLDPKTEQEREATQLIAQMVKDFRDGTTGVSDINRQRWLQQARFTQAVQAENAARADAVRQNSIEFNRFVATESRQDALQMAAVSGQGFKLGHQIALRA